MKSGKWLRLLATVLTAALLLALAPGAVMAEGEPENLYAQAACLMDADSGRILYGKDAQKALPMASTTKIMTCILVLEHGELTSVAAASRNAAAQPEVHLGVTQGEGFLIQDLLYSLMLESHNDSAVMLAEALFARSRGRFGPLPGRFRRCGKCSARTTKMCWRARCTASWCCGFDRICRGDWWILR